MENIKSRKTKKLPRHVEGRIMIGQMPLRNLLLILPLAAVIIFFAVIFFSKASVFIAVVLLGVVLGLFSEFGQKETGLELLVDIVKYQVNGDEIFERVRCEVPIYKRFSKNKTCQQRKK
jgi:hypothetical protein